MSEAVKVMGTAGNMATELSTAAGAIGMSTMTVVEQSQGKIKGLSLDGIVPTARNVEIKAYKLVREAYFVIKAPPSPAVSRFLEFTKGPIGRAVINKNGAIAVN